MREGQLQVQHGANAGVGSWMLLGEASWPRHHWPQTFQTLWRWSTMPVSKLSHHLFLWVMRCSDLQLCFVQYTRTALCRWSSIYSSCHFFFLFFKARCHLALLVIWTLILLSWAISDWPVRSWVCIQISLPRKLWPFVRAITYWATDLLLF